MPGTASLTPRLDDDQQHAGEAERHPDVRLGPDVLYVDEGDILSSAGSAAGLDLCLHIVRRDHGPDIANQVARHLVERLEQARTLLETTALGIDEIAVRQPCPSATVPAMRR
jgi:transcriptional regulator GlxA family with amidase domain